MFSGYSRLVLIDQDLEVLKLFKEVCDIEFLLYLYKSFSVKSAPDICRRGLELSSRGKGGVNHIFVYQLV